MRLRRRLLKMWLALALHAMERAAQYSAELLADRTLDANALVPGSAAPFDLTGVRIGAERYAVIGSYPDAFVFSGTWKNKLVRIGNSVPPLFMRSIAGHVSTEILGNGRSQ